MTDVAQLAGVSHQTVSRVLNDHPSVRPQTRLKVLAAIQQLGYRPNAAAKALATGRSRTLGVIAQPSALYGPASTQTSFGRAAAEAGFPVSVANLRGTDERAVAEAVERLLAQRVAGIAVLAPVVMPKDAFDQVPAGVPVVLIDPAADEARSHVRVDQEAGGRLATEYLLSRGHATVWHVAGPQDWFDSRGRAAGWKAALKAAGVEVPPPLPADWSARSGYDAGSMLARMPEVTAVFAANDHLALGIIRALTERGRRVPEDVSIVGFDDVPEAEFFLPPLTTVRQDFGALARQCLALLLHELDGTDPASRGVIEPTLVVRASAAAPR